jgi:membrane-bound metal-dependent hydrolase YbcI (DUF457 family)
MFNSTHTLVGLAIARTGPEKWAPYATATAIIASNLPDIDSIALFWGPAAYLDYHRGVTHSVLGVPILALLLSVAMYPISKAFWKTYAVALIAMGTHPALDYLNSYGLRPWLPWDGTWHYGDVVFIFDPYLDLILLAGILLRRIVTMKRLVIWTTLAIAAAYIAVRVELHATALRNLHREASQAADVERFAALPQISAVVWEGVVETKNEDAKFPIYVLGRHSGLEREAIRIPRSPASDLIAKASKAPSAAALLRFARFPAVRVEQVESGYRVTFIDFRFYARDTQNSLGSESDIREAGMALSPWYDPRQQPKRT